MARASYASHVVHDGTRSFPVIALCMMRGWHRMLAMDSLLLNKGDRDLFAPPASMVSMLY
jgi:hypothetical protein